MADKIAALPAAPPSAVAPRRAPGQWLRARPRLALFVVAFVPALAVSLHVIASVGATGDEPWYLLQAYCLLHFHTVDLTPVLRDHRIYAQFLGNLRDDHTYDFTGNGARVLAYLPGYALLIAPVFALGGRALIGVLQAALTALMIVLVYDEAHRLYGSRRVELFAALACLTALPVLLYAGQLFPTTFAMCLSFAGYVLVVRRVRGGSGRRLIYVGVALGAIAFALPWLHAKYALMGAVLPVLGIVALLPRLRARPLLRANCDAWAAALAMAGLATLGFALMLAYDRHYFGTWYPQYRQGGPGAFGSPELDRAATLYGRMFFDAQSGLIPWVPLLLLAVPGFVVLLRRAPIPARYVAGCLAGLLGSFVSVAVAPHIGMAGALPARFDVESVPFFALCAAGAYAAGDRYLRQVVVSLARRGGASARRLGVFGVGRVALAGACLLLLAVDLWLTAAAQLDPGVLYPSPAGVRLAEEYPAIVPGAWFALFPESEAPPLYRGVARFDAANSQGQRTVPEGGGSAYLAQPGALPAHAVIARSEWLGLPPGRYLATFQVACGAPTGAQSAPFEVAALRVQGIHYPVVAQSGASGATCAGVAHPMPVTLPFTSDGYHFIVLAVLYGGAGQVEVTSIAFGQA